MFKIINKYSVSLSKTELALVRTFGGKKIHNWMYLVVQWEFSCVLAFFGFRKITATVNRVHQLAMVSRAFRKRPDLYVFFNRWGETQL